MLANEYKTRLYDSAGDEFKDVTCSMFPEKTFHSLSKKFTQAPLFLLFPLKFFCPISTGHKDNIKHYSNKLTKHFRGKLNGKSHSNFF